MKRTQQTNFFVALNREESASSQKKMADAIKESGDKWDDTQFMTVEKVSRPLHDALVSSGDIPKEDTRDYWLLHDGNSRAATISAFFPNITSVMAVEAKAEGRLLLFCIIVLIAFPAGFPCIPLSHALAISRIKNVTAHNIRSHCVLDDVKCMLELLRGDELLDFSHPLKIIDTKGAINFQMLIKRMVSAYTSHAYCSCSLLTQF